MKMKQYNLVIDEKLISEVDALIKARGLYNSRSDFIRDAVRTRLIELKKLLDEGFEEAEIADDAGDDIPPEDAPHADEHRFRGVH
ncbi:MAG: ribbon-helix-helix domain-containing protein [Candidatus Diapherotrites archaeon]|nr:ribbon-helix-helix domain-containing protein [Candidatus Micrarchaeota archaeon]MBU1939685.1 ribbon-helix-helix domain-containing protein [Candidatus Micrarchaeota archaeon]